ncbi:MAG TPA: amidase [Acidimicrobiales bacterium]|nr:amidase [Acidimicrobiales bacterium]
MTDLSQFDATAQAELVSRGEISAVELVEDAIARIEKYNPSINAVIHRMFDSARKAASGDLPDGPFRGVPMLLKDLMAHSAGDPLHEGMRALRDIGWTEKEDTYLVQRLRRGGFVFVGKTNTPEMGLFPTTEPAVYGPTKNPWDPSRSAGGSSGGSAAAVAARMVPLAHANDGGGSIRIPASECGLVGLKPTRARNSLGPEYGEVWAGLAIEHVVTRSVRDSGAVLDLTSGPMPGDPYFAPPPTRPFSEEVGADPGRLRVGVLVTDLTGAAEVHPECRAAVSSAVELLEGLGHDVTDQYPLSLEDEGFVTSFLVVYAAYADWCLEDTFRKTGHRIDEEGCEPATWALAEMSRGTTTAEYLMAVQYLHSCARRVRAWWEVDGYDVLVTPTIPELPLKLGQFESTRDNPLTPVFRAAGVVPFAAPFNVTGQPAVSLPLHWSDEGLPVGVQLVGGYGREDLLLRLASQLEEARPWAHRRPVGFE